MTGTGLCSCRELLFLSLSNSHINRYCHRLHFDCSPHRQSIHGHDHIYSIYNNDHLYSTITSTASTVGSVTTITTIATTTLTDTIHANAKRAPRITATSFSKTTSKAISNTTSKISSATSIPVIRSHDRAIFLWPLLFSGYYLSPATFSPVLPFSGHYLLRDQEFCTKL